MKRSLDCIKILKKYSRLKIAKKDDMQDTFKLVSLILRDSKTDTTSQMKHEMATEFYTKIKNKSILNQ